MAQQYLQYETLLVGDKQVAKQVGKAQKNKITVSLTLFHSSFTFKLKRLLEFKLHILKLYSTSDKYFGGTGEVSVN